MAIKTKPKRKKNQLEWTDLEKGKCYLTNSPNPNHRFGTRIFRGAYHYPGVGNSLLTSVEATAELPANRLLFREPFPIKPDIFTITVEFASQCKFVEVKNPYC